MSAAGAGIVKWTCVGFEQIHLLIWQDWFATTLHTNLNVLGFRIVIGGDLSDCVFDSQLEMIDYQVVCHLSNPILVTDKMGGHVFKTF